MLTFEQPGPPHHPIFGHMKIMAEATRASPRGAAGQNVLLMVKHLYDLPDLFYLDLWPLFESICITTHPSMSSQFVVRRSMPKHPLIGEFMQTISRGDDIVSADGPLWKTWRSAFNPGFSVSHIMTMMPGIVDDVATFARILHEKAVTNELFRMEHLATRLTVDVIGRVVLRSLQFPIGRTSARHGVRKPSQMDEDYPWVTLEHVKCIFNIFRPFVHWWNLRQMDTYVGRVLEERFASRNLRSRKTKHLKENNVNDTSKLDPRFKDAAIRNIKTFIFAGHDTSSSTICYAHYQLSQNPEALARLRQECEEIFGSDVTKTGDMIKEDPYLLNKMKYGDAVVRETLRLHSPASAIRSGSKDFFIIDPDTGESYPTDGFMLHAHSPGHLLNPKVWQEPMSFRPERWLTEQAPPIGADRDAFVAFSKGIRNCIGQELALLEVRMVLAMTVRQFDFHEAFDEVEKLREDGSGYPSDLSGVQKQFGEKAYQIQLGTAKPREGMPCRFSLAKM
ncbi:cytochrome P450 [Aureobasidium pullulans]|uniref:Cytochrome P450 n=1 Tax=Aureobasidium pullulans TaxID=5580 RepID=A0A4S8YWB4_AURPU|nr:cytochrome P450 [Aureobasidium pullulans]